MKLSVAASFLLVGCSLPHPSKAFLQMEFRFQRERTAAPTVRNTVRAFLPAGTITCTRLPISRSSVILHYDKQTDCLGAVGEEVDLEQAPLKTTRTGPPRVEGETTEQTVNSKDHIRDSTAGFIPTLNLEDIFAKAAGDIKAAGDALTNNVDINYFYGMLDITSVASGDPRLAALNLAIKKAQEAIDKAAALPEETARFRKTLDSMLKTIETSRTTLRRDEDEECMLTSELCYLVEEGEDFVCGLEEPESYIATLSKQLLQGNSCPASKLSHLSLQMREAEARLQLHQAMEMIRRKNHEESGLLRAQVDALTRSVSELKRINNEPTPTNDAQEAHTILRSQMKRHGRKRRAFKKFLARTIFRGGPCMSPKEMERQQATSQLNALKDTSVLNQILKDGSLVPPNFVQDIEDHCVPLRKEAPVPPNEIKRLRVLRNMRLVQYEMEGVPVGNGFEYHRDKVILSIIQVLKATVPVFAEGAVFTVVANDDAYMLTGNNAQSSCVVKRVEVPCQHVLCLTDADKDELSVDGFKSHDVLAINLRGSHNELTSDFCCPPETKSYIGAAVRSCGVTIGSLCVSSDKTIEELGWDDQQSKYLRQVVSVLEEQLVQLCIDWKTDGVPPAWPLAER